MVCFSVLKWLCKSNLVLYPFIAYGEEFSHNIKSQEKKLCLMKIDGNQLRPGNVIFHQGRLWSIAKTQHTQPGKGGAYMQVELKDLVSGTKKNERFRAAEIVELVYLEEVEYQFLYEDQGTFILMNQDTYDQINVKEQTLSAPASFLREGMIVTVGFYENEPIFVNLPDQVVLKVIEADPVVKGQTAASSYKPAVLENGERVMVPPHIEPGTKVIVDTRDGTYVERYKG